MRPIALRVLYAVLGLVGVGLVALAVRAVALAGTGSGDPVPASTATAAPSPPGAEPSAPDTVPPTVPPTLPPPSPGTVPPDARSPGLPSTPPPPTGSSPTFRPLAGVVIALDPGHNGANARHLAQINRTVDAGGLRKACNTTGTETDGGYPEAQFTWEVGQRVSRLLASRGATVRSTRSTNTGWGPCVDTRGRFGGTVGARLALSLHADGAPASGSGFHVIVPALRRGYTDDILPASRTLGLAVRDALVRAGFRPSTYTGSAGMVTRGDLGTLNLASVPTVMVECGNMRNDGDAALLRSAAGQQRMAVALADALTAYARR